MGGRSNVGSARLARILAFLSAIIAVAQWVVFVPLIAMGAVDADRLYSALLIAAFFGWPLAAAAAFAAAVLLDRRPRAATVLLVLVGAGLLYPFFAGGILALVAAALAFRSRSNVTSPVAGGWLKVKELSRAGIAGIVAVVALLIVAPSLVSTVFYLRSGHSGGPSAAEPTRGPFADPDQALSDYAQSRWPPFQGPCPGSVAKGSCVDSSERFDSTASYVLCTVDHVECATLHITRKGNIWAVTEVEEPSPIPKQ